MKKQKHMLRTCLFLVILFLLIFLPGLLLTPKVVMKYHLGGIGAVHHFRTEGIRIPGADGTEAGDVLR